MAESAMPEQEQVSTAGAPREQDVRELLPWVLSFGGLFLVLLAPLFIGIYHLNEVARDLGVALLVAGAATIGIETKRVKKFSEALEAEVKKKLHDIEQATTDLVYRGPLPSDYYQKVSKIMLQNRFWRPYWRFEIEFAWKDSAREFLDFSFSQVYKVENRHGSTVDYPIDHFEYLYWEDRYPDSTRFTHVRAKIEGSEGWLFNQSAIERAAVRTDAGIRFQRSVPMARGQTLVVDEGSTKVMSHHDLEYFIVGDPTQGLECRVEYPDDLAVELEVPELELKPDGFPTPPEEPVVGGRLRSLWQFSRPMPPYSYFVVRWRKRKPADG